MTGPATRDVALRVEDLDFSYDHLQVLFGVSIEVQQGEALALLGTNGAGKSTLLKAVVGLEKPTRGTVTYRGDDITSLPAERLASRGLLLVVGGRSVFADLTVDENLEMQALTARFRPAQYKVRLDSVFTTFPRWRSPGAPRRDRCPVGSSSNSRSRRRCCSIPRCSASTSCPSAWRQWSSPTCSSWYAEFTRPA